MAERLLHQLETIAFGRVKALALAWLHQNAAVLITAGFAVFFVVWAYFLFRPKKKPKAKPRARPSTEPEPEPSTEHGEQGTGNGLENGLELDEATEEPPDRKTSRPVRSMVVDSEKKRQAMLAALEGAKRVKCVLLAVDVVGSTQMKAGEETATIAASFTAYRHFVEKVLAEHHVWKQAWTPDGVMSAFRSRKSALAAAKDLLKGLGKFNEQVNQLKMPFRVRCGMNEGSLALFDDSELQDVADRAIDIAGHMQKDARENTVWLPDVMYRELEDIRGFRATAKFVDGFEAYEWAVRD
jgi:class 3 adenylate cyclase